MKSISIAEALSDIKAGKQCTIVYVRSTKNKGSLKTVRCIHGYAYKNFTPTEKKHYIEKQDRGKHTLNGTMPLIDVDTDEQLTLLISHMIFLNDKKIIH